MSISKINIVKTIKNVKAYGLALVVAGLFLVPATASAANTSIVGGTNGPACDSGGYFTPGSTTITSGDTVTISVPADDPYSGGMEIHGFPGGDFVILPGGSHTTAALTATVSYYGTWPSSGCMKGSGSITVSAPVVTPPPPPTPTPPTSTPTPTTTPTSTATSSTTKTITPTPTPTPTASTPATTSAGAITDTTTPDKTPVAKSKTTTPVVATAVTKPKQAVGFTTVASVSTGAVAILVIGGFFGWRWLLGRRLPPTPTFSTSQAAAAVSIVTPAPSVTSTRTAIVTPSQGPTVPLASSSPTSPPPTDDRPRV